MLLKDVKISLSSNVYVLNNTGKVFRYNIEILDRYGESKINEIVVDNRNIYFFVD